MLNFCILYFLCISSFPFYIHRMSINTDTWFSDCRVSDCLVQDSGIGICYVITIYRSKVSHNSRPPFLRLLRLGIFSLCRLVFSIDSCFSASLIRTLFFCLAGLLPAIVCPVRAWSGIEGDSFSFDKLSVVRFVFFCGLWFQIFHDLPPDLSLRQDNYSIWSSAFRLPYVKHDQCDCSGC